MTMSKELKTKAVTEDRKLILTRKFNAPPELIFEMWSDCNHLKHWWGPKEWPMHECVLNFQEGGEWKYCLRGPDEGDESWGLAIYQEINRPDKIVYRDHFTDSDGNINKGMPELLVTVEFLQRNGKTEQVSSVIFSSNEERDSIVRMGMVEGMDSSLDRLDEYLLLLQQDEL